MGTNNLTTVSGGQVIDPAHNNNINTALTTDFVPRNSSGAPISEAGGLGTLSLFWSAIYSRILQLTSTISIEKTESPDTMVFKVGGTTEAELVDEGFTPASFGPRAIGSPGVDPGKMEMAISTSLLGFTSTSTNEDVTGSDTIVTTKGGAALVGFYGVFNDGTGGGIYGTSGGERFKIKNVTAAVDITGPMFVQTATTQNPLGGFTQVVASIGGTPGAAQTLRAEAIDIGVTISGVRMFVLEI